jgi:hypothetical protein
LYRSGLAINSQTYRLYSSPERGASDAGVKVVVKAHVPLPIDRHEDYQRLIARAEQSFTRPVTSRFRDTTAKIAQVDNLVIFAQHLERSSTECARLSLLVRMLRHIVDFLAVELVRMSENVRAPVDQKQGGWQPSHRL